jgi:hypothetical protein
MRKHLHDANPWGWLYSHIQLNAIAIHPNPNPESTQTFYMVQT